MKTRILQTRFWKDEYVTSLSSEEKLMFIYILTNDTVNMVGVYQLYTQEVALWCGVTNQKVIQFFQKLQNDKKIIYKNNWIKLLNFQKYQNYGGGRQEEAFKKELNQIPGYMHDDYADTSIDISIDTSMHTRHKSKTINHKSKTIKQKVENFEKKSIEENAKKIIETFNEVFNLKLISFRAWVSNFESWLEHYSLDDILIAIRCIQFHPYWGDKMRDPTLLMRKKNMKGEDTDYIGEMLQYRDRVKKVVTMADIPF